MSDIAKTIWSKCLEYIKNNISEEAFATWFTPTKAIKFENNVLFIGIPSDFYFEYLEEHYIDIIKSALEKNIGSGAKLCYKVMISKANESSKEVTIDRPSSNKLKIKPQEVDAPLYIEQGIKNPFVIPGLQKFKVDSQLNPNCSLDNFIEGDFNRLARSAGKAIAERPGKTSFNPLFIHSDVGLGKTHLANAIGLEVKKNHPEKVVLYVSTEKFSQQFQEATRANNRNDFIHFYQNIDVLIVDDIQFLSGKKGTQEVFFHIFNHLHQNNKQVILTSDKSPADIQDVEHRLISRFKWGLSTEMSRPDLKSRIEILKLKMVADGINLASDILEYIANNIKNNIRELEGAMNSIIAQATLNKKEITVDLVKETLKSLISNSKKDITVDLIQDIVCQYFDLDKETLQSKTRKREIVQARQLAMYFSKKYTNTSLASIGNQIGKRDHATVLHACKTVENLSATDKTFHSYVEDLKKTINFNA